MNSVKPYVEKRNLYVYLIVSYNGTRYQLATGLTACEKFDGLIFPKNEPNGRAKTARLTKLYSDVEEFIIRYPNEKPNQVKDKLKSVIAGREINSTKPIGYYTKLFLKNKLKESTKQVYRTSMKRINDFDADATFDTIDRDWLERYEVNELRRGRKQNGIAIDLRNIRTVFNWAIDNEYTTKYPFRKFSIKNERGEYLYLNIDEIKELRDIPVEPFMEKYRDIFMLGFYLIGINISDLLELPKKAMRNGRISYRRNKTSRLYDIKVEPEAMAIIEKYKGTEHLLNILDEGTKETSFRHRLNDYIKKIGKVEMVKNKRGALVKKLLTPLHPDIVWYTARRSWATIAAELDIPKETIGKALGHSEWDTTERYIRFDYKKVDEANRKVLDSLK